MNILVILTVYIGVVHSRNVINNPTIGSRIISGTPARAAQFPWQAAVYVDRTDGKYFCGGSVITRQWILSASQCVLNGLLFTIHLGSTTLQSGDSNRVIIASATHVQHPNFNVNTLENDIGLIRLHLPIEFSDTIGSVHVATPSTLIEAGEITTTTGWGQISDNQAGVVNDLHYVSLVVISNIECGITYGNQIKETMFCTVGNFNEGICTGDTGGPLTMAVGFNTHVQLGISSFFSYTGCESLHPSGFTRLNLYSDWIQNITSV